MTQILCVRTFKYHSFIGVVIRSLISVDWFQSMESSEKLKKNIEISRTKVMEKGDWNTVLVTAAVWQVSSTTYLLPSPLHEKGKQTD